MDRRKNAYGVTYMRHGMQKFVRAKKEIVISAGAIDSPRLLMLSGIGMRSDLHQVGVRILNIPRIRKLEYLDRPAFLNRSHVV